MLLNLQHHLCIFHCGLCTPVFLLVHFSDMIVNIYKYWEGKASESNETHSNTGRLLTNLIFTERDQF